MTAADPELDTGLPPAGTDEGTLKGLLRSMRPRQWAKQVLLFAAPAGAGVLLEPRVLARVLIGVALWCAAAGGVYLLNDAMDVEHDRRHPVKRHRPIASGAVPVRLAIGVAAVLLTASVAAAAIALSGAFALVLGTYAALTIAYSVRLKHVVIVDLAVVAAGFVLRAIGGGVAAEVEISSWFLIVASFGSLFMVTGKRHAEHANSDQVGTTRAVLSTYTLDYLHYIRLTSSAVTLLAYCLWAFDEATADAGALFFELSIIPFTLGVFRYALLLEAGLGEAPEELVASDRPLQLAGVCWGVLFAAGVYAG